MKEIIITKDLDNLKKILTIIDSNHSTFSESWNHLEHYEEIIQKKEKKMIPPKNKNQKK